MFKTFSKDELSASNLAKSSVIKAIRSSILETYPRLEGVIDVLIPRKSPVSLTKSKAYTLLVVENEVLFLQPKDGPWLPTMRTLHKCEEILFGNFLV